MKSAESALLSEIMTTNIVTIDITERVEEALRLMVKFDIGSVVVTDKQKPVGIITERDVTRAALREIVYLDYRFGVSCLGLYKPVLQTWRSGEASRQC